MSARCMFYGLMFLIEVSVMMTSKSNAVDRLPTRFPDWNAGRVLERTQLIAVVELPQPVVDERPPRASRFFTVSCPELFGGLKGAAKVRRFEISEILTGELDVGSQIVVVQPPGTMDHYAHIVSGEMLMFLRCMDDDEVGMLKNNVARPRQELSGPVWIFAEEENQWMSWIQFSAFRNGQLVDFLGRSRLASQLERYGGIQRTKPAVIGYIRSLLDFRSRVLADQQLPPENELDKFQRDIMRRASLERSD